MDDFYGGHKMTTATLADRFIPYSSLRYTTEAFIDYRIPGCAPKKNYALIGPGVSQNPDQPVSLREKHGFQVGGVAMPPGKTNPPHMHFTAEVFICTRSEWDLQWGFNPDPHKARVRPGDIATVPTWIYRGFQNMGAVEGFMFTALGQDDTGGILWGPQTLEAARQQGVHLTEDYRIIDEQLGQRWDDATMRRLQPMTPQEIEQLQRWTPEQMGRRVVRHADLQWSSSALLDSALPGCGGQLAPVIGLGMSEDREQLAPVMNSHGFSIEWLRLPPGGRLSRHRLASKQVMICYQGTVRLEIGDKGESFALQGTDEAWDSYALPADTWRSLHNTGIGPAEVLLMTPGDARKHIEWAPDVVQAAAAAGLAIDANGYVAPKRFTDRSQR
jgi:quercetin dioxygenase-like cupin family protein